MVGWTGSPFPASDLRFTRVLHAQRRLGPDGV